LSYDIVSENKPNESVNVFSISISGLPLYINSGSSVYAIDKRKIEEIKEIKKRDIFWDIGIANGSYDTKVRFSKIKNPFNKSHRKVNLFHFLTIVSFR
jgi:hypothetical protein